MKLDQANQTAHEQAEDDEVDSDCEEAKESEVTEATKATFDKTVFDEGERSCLLAEKAASAAPPKPEAASAPPKPEAMAAEKGATDGNVTPTPPVLTPPRTIPSTSKSPAFMHDLSPAFRKMNLSGSEDAESISAKGEGTEVSTISTIEDGTEAHPWIAPMNLVHPERTRDFEAHFVSCMKRLGWKRPGVHIRKPILAPDMDHWTASIPPKGRFPLFENRCVQIKRPAFDFVQRHPELCHDKLKCACQAAKEAHEDHLERGNPIECVHHLLVFDEAVVFENAHFAGEATREVETHHNPITIEGDHSGNEFGENLRCQCVHWEVAFKDGGVKLKDEKDNKKVDKKQLH